ncbi:MAG: CAP domain-containing protein [Minisyncoccia bacterium]
MKKRFKDFFLAHKGNFYKPAIFAAESVLAILLVLVVFESAYVFHVNVITKNTNFTAAVLPAALSILTNTDRSAQGLGQLEYDSRLSKAAQEKANDMAINGYFSHVSPTGKTPWYWLDQMGYKYDYAGENLAVNFTDSQDVQTAWMNSPSHRDNILKREYTKSAIAVSQGMYQGQPVTFVVQLFAKPSTVSFPVAPIKTTVPKPPVIVVKTSPIPPVPAKEESEEVSKQVLGVTEEQVAPQATSTPTQTITPLPTSIEKAIVQAAASPTYTFEYLLIAFIIGVILLLGLAVIVHVWTGVRYSEVVGGGLALIVVALLLISINKNNTPSVIVPTNTQSASVIMSL